MRRFMVPIAAAALLAAAPQVGSAEPKGNVLKLGAGQTKGALLTRDELRACLQQESALKADNERTRSGQAALEAEKAEVQRSEEALAAERTSIDASQQQAVDAFNARLAALRERREALRTQALAYNDQAEAYNTRQQRWTEGCAGRPYDERDYYAIQRGK